MPVNFSKCEKCIHKPICLIEKDFSDLINEIKNKDTSWTNIDVNCNYYTPGHTSNIRADRFSYDLGGE